MTRPPHLLTASQAAAVAGVSKRRLLALIAEGRVLGAKLYGRQYLLTQGWSVIPGNSGPPLSPSVPRESPRR